MGKLCRILIQTELLKSRRISTADLNVETNEITLTGNTIADDFTITSTMNLNALEVLLPHESEEEILTLMKNELAKSYKIGSGVLLVMNLP